MRDDVETAKLLPDDSESQRYLLEHVQWQINRLRERERERRRDWSGLTLGLIFALLFGYATAWLFMHDEWWRLFGVVTVLLSALRLYGIVERLPFGSGIARAAPSIDLS